MSSCVGPIPPVVKTYVKFFLTSFMVFTMEFSTSGITLTSSTFTPSSLSHLLKCVIFTSCVLPDNISLPITTITAFTFLLTFSIF